MQQNKQINTILQSLQNTKNIKIYKNNKILLYFVFYYLFLDHGHPH